METYPINTIKIDQAKQMQFDLIDKVTNYFTGSEIIKLGDLGVVQPYNQPIVTKKIENILADFFNTESAILVRGAGTGALRYSIFASLDENRKILVHDAPIYPTTRVSLEMFSAKIVYADFNNINDIKRVMSEHTDISCALIQYTRQKPSDSYDYKEVVDTISDNKSINIVTDDNYACMKVLNLGASFGAKLSTFSSFKLHGPEGIGVIIGSKKMIEKIRKMNYSGGCQVQGHEAQAVLRGLINSPVSLSIQSEVVDVTTNLINKLKEPLIKKAFIANAQSKVIIVEFNQPIANELLIECEKLGACPNPVGAESKYEFVPMFYKVSGTFILDNPDNAKNMIRINPMKSGEDSILKILKEGLKNVSK